MRPKEITNHLKPKPPRLILPPNKRIVSSKDYNRRAGKQVIIE